VMMMLVSPLGGRLTSARGPKTTLILGALVMAAGYAVTMGLMGAAWGLMLGLMVTSAGVGFAYGAMPALIMGSVPRSETAAANSFNTLMRSIGVSSGAAVVGAVLGQMTTTMGGHTFVSENGFRVALLIGAGVAVLSALIAIALPSGRKDELDETEQPTHEPVNARA
ncbi:MFS transporter, partial [Actinomadura adrarensis]